MFKLSEIRSQTVSFPYAFSPPESKAELSENDVLPLMLTIEEDRMHMAPANGSSEFEGFIVIVNQPDRQCDNPNDFQLFVAIR